MNSSSVVRRGKYDRDKAELRDTKKALKLRAIDYLPFNSVEKNLAMYVILKAFAVSKNALGGWKRVSSYWVHDICPVVRVTEARRHGRRSVKHIEVSGINEKVEFSQAVLSCIARGVLRVAE